MLVHPRNMLVKTNNTFESSKMTRKHKQKKRKSTKSKRNLLKDLPDDILYSIVEFLNPICAQERVNILCNSIIRGAPYLSKFFVKIKNGCEEDEHTIIGSKSLCVMELDHYVNNREKSSYYMKNIISKIAEDRRFHFGKKNETYTFHFPDKTNFEDNDPFVTFIKKKLFCYSPYKISHLCCGGNGIYAVHRSKWPRSRSRLNENR